MLRGVMILALLLSGCATSIAEFRQQQLVPVMTATGSHQLLAACVMESLENDETIMGAASFRYAPLDAQRSSILASWLMPAGPFVFDSSPTVELIFMEGDARAVTVSARRRELPIGAADMVMTRSQAIIPMCSQKLSVQVAAP